MDDWLRAHPEIRTISTAVADLNGQARGKRFPVGFAAKALEGTSRMPLSVLNVDIWGDDIEESPLVFETGDRDGVLRPTGRGFVPTPWLANPSAMVPMWMYTDAGEPFYGDPRHALAAVLDRFAERGWQVVAATELEFYLIDDAGDTLQPPSSPRSGKRRLGGEILSLRALDAFDAFFGELYDACEEMGIPAETAISEAGLGQYEINLVHGPALQAADDAWLFKLLVKGLARKHGFAASFMAKPYADHSGTGMHVHFSVVDAEGRNVFDNAARRIEHRVAGGDTNPYLMLAVILGAALTGIEDAIEPPDPIKGNAYARDLKRLPDDWSAAINLFAKSERMERILPKGLIRNYVMTKEQELTYYAELSEAERIDLYLDTV